VSSTENVECILEESRCAALFLLWRARTVAICAWQLELQSDLGGVAAPHSLIHVLGSCAARRCHEVTGRARGGNVEAAVTRVMLDFCPKESANIGTQPQSAPKLLSCNPEGFARSQEVHEAAQETRGPCVSCACARLVVPGQRVCLAGPTRERNAERGATTPRGIHALS
jgi:hypothetical protein